MQAIAGSQLLNFPLLFPVRACFVTMINIKDWVAGTWLDPFNNGSVDV